jgi:hypothetical protein
MCPCSDSTLLPSKILILLGETYCSPFQRRPILIDALVKSQISICISRKELVPISGAGFVGMELTLMTNPSIAGWQKRGASITY